MTCFGLTFLKFKWIGPHVVAVVAVVAEIEVAVVVVAVVVFAVVKVILFLVYVGNASSHDGSCIACNCFVNEDKDEVVRRIEVMLYFLQVLFLL